MSFGDEFGAIILYFKREKNREMVISMKVNYSFFSYEFCVIILSILIKKLECLLFQRKAVDHFCFIILFFVL